MSLVGTIPYAYAGSGVGTVAAYTHVDYNYDYAVDGIPFLSAVDGQHPAIRKTAPYRRTRLDSSADPGDGSMDFWWLKGQSTFHGGAGQLYIDTPISQGAEIRPLRYQSSAGCDPWEQGKVTLLKDTQLVAAHGSSTPSKMVCLQVGSSNYLVWSDGLNVKVALEVTAGSSYTVSTATLAAPFAANIQSITTDGRYWYATDGNTVHKGDPSAPGTASSVLYTGMGGGTAVLGWAKLMLVLGFTSSTSSKVFTLDPAAVSAALPAATFTHPTPTFVWTCVTEGPGAFYVGGYAGSHSTIFKFVLNTSSITPTISSGIVLADLPPGEVILAMFSYLNSAVGLVTSLGVRIGQFTSGVTTGDFQYGPLSVTFDSVASVGDVIGQDRFIFATYKDESGLSGTSNVASLVRLDLSQQLNVRPFSYQPDARFAWAPDLRAYSASAFQAGTPSGVGVLNDGRKAFLVPSVGVYVEHPTRYTTSGVLTSSRIRFDTLDPKLAKYIRLRGAGTSGSLGVAVNQDSDSGGGQAVTFDLTSAQDSDDVALSLGFFQFVTVTATLTAGNSQTETPTLLGYQLKALPAQKRQRFIRVPLLCYDHERDDTDQEIGYDGYALERLLALEALDAAGDIINFQILSPWPDNEYTTLGVIEDLEFQQNANPTEFQGWGGVINLTIRTVS